MNKGLIILSCLEGKWGGKDIPCSPQNVTLSVDLLLISIVRSIFFHLTVHV